MVNYVTKHEIKGFIVITKNPIIPTGKARIIYKDT